MKTNRADRALSAMPTSVRIALVSVVVVEGAVIHAVLGATLADGVRWIQWSALAFHALLLALIGYRFARVGLKKWGRTAP